MAFLSHHLAGLLSQAASGLLAKNSILLLLGLNAIALFGALLPPALLLATMIALGRLYRDSEMTALFACGIGPGAIYGALLWLAVPTAIFVGLLTLVIVPHSMALQYKLINQARKEAEISVFNPGSFRDIAGGQHTIYVSSLGDSGKTLENIFVRSFTNNGIAVMTAKRGHQRIDNENSVRYIVLSDGYRYEGNPGSSDYNSVHFERLTVRVDSVPQDSLRIRRRAVPSGDLARSSDPALQAELQQRLSSPISVFLLVMLAPLLARSNPREGRYARVIAAVFIYAIYFNLLGLGEAWIKRGVTPVGLGLWWAHGLLLVFCIGLWLKSYPPARMSSRTSPKNL